MTIYEQLQQNKAQLDYVRDVLNRGGLETWEAKEYTVLESNYVEIIQTLNQAINEYENLYPISL